MSVRSLALWLIAIAAMVGCDAPPRVSDGDSAARPPVASAVPNSEPSEDPIDPETGLEASCQFAKENAHPDPGTLLREHLRLDAEGKLRTTGGWIDSAVDCPGHLGGPDTYSMIAGYEVGDIAVRDSVATGIVTFQRLASVAPNYSFDVDTTSRVDTVSMIKTKFGWRIRHQTMPWLNILRAHADGLSPADSARADSLIAATRRGA